MDWSRLGAAILDALLFSVLVGGLFSPPDPFTQLVAIPAVFLVALPFTYRREPRIYDRGWDRHVLFVAFVLAAQFVWNLLVRVEVGTPTTYSPIRLVVLLAGILFGAWVAYLGGLDRLRGEPA